MSSTDEEVQRWAETLALHDDNLRRYALDYYRQRADGVSEPVAFMTIAEEMQRTALHSPNGLEAISMLSAMLALTLRKVVHNEPLTGTDISAWAMCACADCLHCPCGRSWMHHDTPEEVVKP